jgi:zinc protease
MLANGLRVRLVGNDELPVVSGALLIRAGSEADPAEKRGLAAVSMRSLVAGGTKALPGDRLRERIEAMGASLTVSTQTAYSAVLFRCLREDFGEVLGILAALAVAPELDDEGIDSTLGAFRTAVATRNENYAIAVTREAHRRVSGLDSPAAAMMEYDTLDNIGYSDIRGFLRDYAGPARSILVVEGAQPGEPAEASIGKLFGDWKASNKVAEAGPAPEAAEARMAAGVHHVDNRDLRRSAFAIAGPGGTITGPEYAAMAVAAEVAGGRSAGRVWELGRGNGRWGLQSASAWSAGYESQGMFLLSGSVEPTYTPDALEALLALLKKLRSEPVAAAEVELAKLRMLHDYAVALNPPGMLAIRMATGELLGVPAGHVAGVWDAIRGVTPAQVHDALGRHLDPEKLVIVVAGPETLYQRPLARLGRPEFDLNLAIPEPRPYDSPADPGSRERATAMLARMAKALGGAERLSKVRSLDMRFKGRMRTGSEVWTDTAGWERWVAPEVFRQETELGPRKTVTFYNGSIAWQWSAGTLYAASPAALLQVRGMLFRYFFRLTSETGSPKTASHLGANIVQVVDGAGNGVRIYLDQETGLPNRLTYRALAPNGASISMEESLSEWSEHDGIRWPGRVTIKENGRRAQEISLVSIRFNGDIKVQEMEAKP